MNVCISLSLTKTLNHLIKKKPFLLDEFFPYKCLLEFFFNLNFSGFNDAHINFILKVFFIYQK